MIILDTGPIVTLLVERRSEGYEKCRGTFEAFRGDLLTTSACLTEAVYFLDTWHNQAQL